MSNNIKFYIYTAVVFVAMFFYLEQIYGMPHYYEEWEILIPHYAVAFFVTFGARWLLQSILKSKDKKED